MSSSLNDKKIYVIEGNLVSIEQESTKHINLLKLKYPKIDVTIFKQIETEKILLNIINDLNTFSFFSEGKIRVIYDNSNILNSKNKNDLKIFYSNLKLPDSHFLFILIPTRSSQIFKEIFCASNDVNYFSFPLITVDSKRNWNNLDLLIKNKNCIDKSAVIELAKRILKESTSEKGIADNFSVIRFIEEIEKLSLISKTKPINLQLVQDNIQDRGEENSWRILDAIGEGKIEKAIEIYKRFMDISNDASKDRFMFFSSLASYCKQIVTFAGVAKSIRISGKITTYEEFNNKYVTQIKAKNSLLSSIHPYKIFKLYLCCLRLGKDKIISLSWRVLETEMRLKGESNFSDVVVQNFIVYFK